jgi:hypothetical protein
MKIKLKFYILGFLLIFAPAVLHAQINYAISNNTAYVTSCANVELIATIASTYQGYPVTSIANQAFIGNSAMYVFIPETVTNIGDQAFCYCSRLSEIIIPDSVTTIGNQAFELCNNLTNVFIPGSVITLGSEAFEGCYSLNNVVISNGLSTSAHLLLITNRL